MTNKEKFSRRIAHRRKVLNMTTRELAEKSGVGESTINFAEDGEAIPPMSDIDKLAQALGDDAIELGILAGQISRRAVRQHIENRRAA